MLKYISLDELNCVVFDIDVSIEYTSKLVCDENILINDEAVGLMTSILNEQLNCSIWAISVIVIAISVGWTVVSSTLGSAMPVIKVKQLDGDASKQES